MLVWCWYLILDTVYIYRCQGRSQPHSPGWARVPGPLSSFFLKSRSFFLIFPPGKALAVPLIGVSINIIFQIAIKFALIMVQNS